MQRAAKVCQLTNVHSPLDQRIYYKEAFSLAAAGYEVCVAGPGPSDMEGVRGGVRVVTVPRGRGVSGRLVNALALFRKAASMRADIYHFHDPELLPLGLLLRLTGGKVIYDCHEHFPRRCTFAAGSPECCAAHFPSFSTASNGSSQDISAVCLG